MFSAVQDRVFSTSVKSSQNTPDSRQSVRLQPEKGFASLVSDSVAHIGEYSNKERSCFILSWLVFQPDSDIPN